MAAVTQTVNRYQVSGHQYKVSATLTSPINTNTWDTGLKQIDDLMLTIVEPAADAADALTGIISGGVVTLSHAGTVTTARAVAWGV